MSNFNNNNIGFNNTNIGFNNNFNIGFHNNNIINSTISKQPKPNLNHTPT
jgi:hypothetical protein